MQQDFVEAAQCARDAGFKWLELHFAHGFLAQSFLSKHSNIRDDAFAGSLENRSRFLVETLAAVRQVWPAELPLTTRLGVLEFDENLAESIEILRRLKAEGLDLIDVSVGLSTMSPVSCLMDAQHAGADHRTHSQGNRTGGGHQLAYHRCQGG